MELAASAPKVDTVKEVEITSLLSRPRFVSRLRLLLSSLLGDLLWVSSRRYAVDLSESWASLGRGFSSFSVRNLSGRKVRERACAL